MSYGTSWQQTIYYNSPYFLKNIIASIYGRLQRRQRYGRCFHEYLQFLLTSQWYSNEWLESFQLQQAKQFLVYAKQHSKFYKRLFEEYAFYPEKLQDFSKLANLPILRKETLRNHLQEIIPDNFGQFRPRWVHTSGTTGMGLQFPLSSECFQREYAFTALHYLWGNIRQSDKLAFCLGHPIAHTDSELPPFWVYDYVNNWLLLSSYHLTQKNLPHYIAELVKFEPDLIAGYPSSIYLLALANRSMGDRVHARAVYTSSETLFDFQRDTIGKSFGCKVFMSYGNTEKCANIAECEKGKYHLKLEHSFVELVDDNNRPVPAGNEGRLVCTGFGNYATPLIRYSIEDIAIFSETEKCDCQRGGKIINRVVGRSDDYIITPDGRFVGRLDHLFKDAVRVRQAQLIQNKTTEVIVRIVKEQSYTTKDEQEILNEARRRLGPSIKIYLEYVDVIERTRNGKFRFIVSNVQKQPILEQQVSCNS